jgi:hypothetical protein
VGGSHKSGRRAGGVTRPDDFRPQKTEQLRQELS